MHTLSNNRDQDGHVLKMTAQMPPLGEADSQEVALEVQRGGQWQEIGREVIQPGGPHRHVPDRPLVGIRKMCLTGWSTKPNDRRTHCGTSGPGTVRRDPVDRPVSVAGLTCQMHYGFPYQPLVKNLKALDPDVLYFSGDQLYEQNGHYGVIREPADRAILNYLRKWYMFGWAFGDVMRDRPTIVLPDDHDVYHGNLWGEGGREMPDRPRYQARATGPVTSCRCRSSTWSTARKRRTIPTCSIPLRRSAASASSTATWCTGD
jgi:alkaline phosphatase D